MSEASSSLPFGDLLRHFRLAAGLTQAKLAERAGLSVRGINDLERGARQTPRKETVALLADALRLTDDARARFASASRPAPPSPAPLASHANATPAGTAVAVPPTSPATPSPAIHTFLIADVRGYTTFTVAHGDEAAARLAGLFAQVARAGVEAHGGQVIELRGDEALAVFASARQALRAAVALQAQFAAAAQADPTLPLAVGIGLDAGEAVPVEGGFRGTALNLAARLCSLAGPGEVLASAELVHLAGTAAGLAYEERGTAQLKGFADPVRVLQVLPVLPVPPAAARAADHAADLAAAAGHQQSAATSSLPLQVQPQRLPVGGYLGALPDGPLVAREAELARLLAVLEVVAGGQGRLVLLAGEPGIGKTRLVQEVTLAARNRGFLVATGRCYEPQQTVAYYPFLEAMSRAYRAAPATVRADLPRRWPEVARLLPDQPIGVQVAPSSGTREEQQRVFWHVTGFLQALAEAQPVALLLDDLQWADSASLDLLQHLARHTHASRILLLGTYRDVEVTPTHPFEAVLRDLGHEHLAERLVVRRLPLAGTAALLAASFGLEHAADEFVAALHARTEGNPFFTVEVLRELVERGDMYQERERWQKRAQEEIALPETIRSVLGQRLANLSAECHTVLQEASVLGPAFDFADLHAMSSHSEAEVEAALEEAGAAVLVRETGRDSYGFDHVLIQQALYDELTARRKQRFHRAAGEALERLGERERDRRVAELAYHFARTDQWEKALRYLRAAAGQAGAAGARREEAALLGQALACAEHLEQGDLATELRAARGHALWALGMSSPASSAWAEAADELKAALAGLSLAIGDERRTARLEQRIRVLCMLAAVHYALLDASNQQLCASEALALAEALSSSGQVPRAVSDELTVLAVAANAEAALNSGELQTSVQLFERAFAMGSEGHWASIVPHIFQYGLSLYWSGRFGTDDIERARAVAELTREARDPNAFGNALENYALMVASGGRYDEALRTLEEARRYTPEQGVGPWYCRAICMLGGLHLEVFDFAGAQALANEALEAARSVYWPPTTVSATIDLLFAFARGKEIGQADALLPAVAPALALARGPHAWVWPIRYAQARAEIARERGEWQHAMHYAQEAMAQARQHGRVKYEVLGMQTHAQALNALGHTREAIAELRAAVERARSVGDPAMFLRAAVALLAIAGDDALLTDARATVERMAAGLPDELRPIFLEAESARLVAHLSH